MTQDDIFFKAEGDQWFKRNRGLLYTDERVDYVLSLIDTYNLKPKKVLEVGASNGWRLAHIAEKYCSTCIGIEPSAQAVADGKKHYKKIQMKRGIATEIPLKEQFDLVIVNFVLHWVSREGLLRAVAEIDRTVKDGGYLVVGDFLPNHPSKVAYHHAPKKGIFTFKQDYAQLFIASNLYQYITSLTFNHDTHALSPSLKGRDRGIVTLLKKTLTTQYILDERGA